MKRSKFLLCLCFLFINSFICAQSPQRVFSLFLIGDAGEYTIDDTARTRTLQHLRQELNTEQYRSNSAVIFLGDNVYPCGWAPANDQGGKFRYEKIPKVCCDEVNGKTLEVNQQKLASQLEGLENYDGSVFMIPGNHDWQRGQRKGQQFVVNERKSFEEYFSSGKLKHGGYYPKYAFGPDDTLIRAAEGIKIRLVFIDSQWWLHAHGSAMEGVDAGNRKERRHVLDGYLSELDTIVHRAKRQNEFILIAQHHPIYTYGRHSAKFIVAPAARLRFQHIGNRQYDYLRKRLDTICNKYSADKLIFAAGHDHNLQYFRLPNYVQLVSGAGSKCTNEKDCSEFRKVKPERNTSVLEMHGEFNSKGFFRIEYFDDNTFRVLIWKEELNQTVTPAQLTDFSFPD